MVSEPRFWADIFTEIRHRDTLLSRNHGGKQERVLGETWRSCRHTSGAEGPSAEAAVDPLRDLGEGVAGQEHDEACPWRGLQPRYATLQSTVRSCCSGRRPSQETFCSKATAEGLAISWTTNPKNPDGSAQPRRETAKPTATNGVRTIQRDSEVSWMGVPPSGERKPEREVRA